MKLGRSIDFFSTKPMFDVAAQQTCTIQFRFKFLAQAVRLGRRGGGKKTKDMKGGGRVG